MARNPDVLDSYNRDFDNTSIVASIAREVDVWADSIIGLAPFEPIVNVIHDVLPANVVNNVTKIPKPSKPLGELMQSISAKLQNFSMGNLSPPGLSRLDRLFD